MKENNYITIPAFLRTRLDLKGSELIITALIYGFSQDGNSWFMGKTGYVAEWAGITDKNVLRCLKSLTEKGILEKKEIFVNNKAKRCYYRFNFECVKSHDTVAESHDTVAESHDTVAESHNDTVAESHNDTVAGCQNSAAECQNGTVAGYQNGTVAGYQNGTVNNNIYNNNIYNNKIKPENEFSGFPDGSRQSNTPQKLRGTTEPRKCLFANSRFAKFDDFERCFDKPEFEQIDILYYYHAVADWSASKGRMQKDWIAQTRNFIRGDKEKGKLHLKPEYKSPTQRLDVAGAMEYLNDDY